MNNAIGVVIMNNSDETQTYYPYVGASGWLTKLHEFFVRSMPARVNVEWLSAPDRIGLSESNARRMLSMMGKLGWIDSSGSLLDEGKNLRLVGGDWEEAMLATVERIYPDLLRQMKSEPDFGPADVEKFFVSATNVGQSGRNQMISVFRWFLREARLTELEQKITGGSRASRKPETQSSRKLTRAGGSADRTQHKSKASPPSVAQAPDANEAPAADARLSAIAAVLRINIDGTWEEDRMEAAFRMLGELLKGDPVDE